MNFSRMPYFSSKSFMSGLMSTSFSRIVFSTIVAVLASCGGGGGGGGGSKGIPNTGVRILHGGIETPPIELYIDGEASSLASGSFGEEGFYGELKAGAHAAVFAEKNLPSAVVINHRFSVPNGQKISFAILNDPTTGQDVLSQLVDDTSDVLENESAIRVINGVIGVESLECNLANGSQSKRSSSVFGTNSSYVVVPPGTVNLRCTRRADGAEVVRKTISIETGEIKTVLVSGEQGFFVNAVDVKDR
jgi:hypothetical protein